MSKKDKKFPFPTYDKPSVAMLSAAAESASRLSASKAQLNELIERDRIDLLASAKEENIGIVHVFDQNYAKGGATIAFRKSSPYKSGTMVEVAVASCSKEDTFSKKIGTRLAIEQFIDGKTIQLPLLWGYAHEDINGAVKQSFMRMLGYSYN